MIACTYYKLPHNNTGYIFCIYIRFPFGRWNHFQEGETIVLSKSFFFLSMCSMYCGIYHLFMFRRSRSPIWVRTPSRASREGWSLGVCCSCLTRCRSPASTWETSSLPTTPSDPSSVWGEGKRFVTHHNYGCGLFEIAYLLTQVSWQGWVTEQSKFAWGKVWIKRTPQTVNRISEV